MIDYVFTDTPLIKDPNDRIARVVNQRTHTDSDLADALANRNIGVSKPEALALIEAITEILLEWIANGDAATLTLGHYHATISGTFKDGEHPKEVNCNITPSNEIIKAAKRVLMRRVEARLQIYIDFIHDVLTNTSNEKITQGGNVKITGHNIKIAGDNKEVGIEFHSVSGSSVYKVESRHIVINKPSELMIVAPKMPAGEKVILKITTQYLNKATKLLKAPRSLTFPQELTII
jgi:nucleoid DNA-binding protein